MPFVRYARDRRGYETLYVMHAFETGRDGRARPRVLYACRSVPYARVGRAPLDESVQRRIATAYPNLEFDWPRLLKEAAASAPRPEKPDKRDEPRKGRGRERERKPRKEPRAAPQVSATAQPVQVGQTGQGEQPGQVEQPAQAVPPVRLDPMGQVEPQEDAPVLDPGPLMVERSWPVVALIGETPALILRGRYIEIANRIVSRVEDPAAQRRLLVEAARLNPEGWRTADAARAGVDGFDAAYDALAVRLRQQVQPPAV